MPVLTRVAATETAVIYTGVNVDDYPVTICLETGHAAELGHPDRLTVTVEAGDLLTHDGEVAA